MERIEDLSYSTLERIAQRAIESSNYDKFKAYEICKQSITDMNITGPAYERAIFHICNILKY